NIPVEHILHLFVLCLLEIFLKPIPLVVFLSFFSVLFYIFPFVSLHDIIHELSLYIPLVLILSIILLILYFYCLLYIVLLILFLLLYVDLDDNAVFLISLLNFPIFHHIFFSIYKSFFCTHHT